MGSTSGIGGWLTGMHYFFFLCIALGGCISWWQVSSNLSAPIRVAGVLLFVIGGFFWITEFKEPGSRSNLGASLLGGAVVALAILQLQVAQDREERQIAQEQEEERRRLADRQTIQLALGQQKDLTNIDLHGLDLSGFWLYGKVLDRANFERGILKGTVLVQANLKRARLIDAQLQKAYLGGARLERANLTGGKLNEANLEQTHLKTATLINADLRGAWLAGADAQGALLCGADLQGVRIYSSRTSDQTKLGPPNFDGAIYDENTKWPEDLNLEARAQRGSCTE